MIAEKGSETPRFLRLGDIVADRVRNVVLRDGELHRVEPRVMDVLVYLTGAEGRIVSRQELMDEVWGTHVVDEAVQRSISLLRAALGCDGRTAPIVETVRGHGYRLTLAPAALKPSARRLPKIRSWSVAALVLAFTAGAAATWVSTGAERNGAVAPVAPGASPSRERAEAPPAPEPRRKRAPEGL